MPSDVKLIMHSLKCDITTGTVGERGKQLNYFLPSKFNFFFYILFYHPFHRRFDLFFKFFYSSLHARFFFKGRATQRFHFY